MGDAGIPDLPLAGGILTLEFFDTFDDGFMPQATVLQGGITVQTVPVPEPTCLALIGMAGAALMVVRRRVVRS